MPSYDLFGWDLLFKTIEHNIKKDSDIIIALVHWFLVRNASFSCVGIGDDKTLGEDETGVETLPDGWNDNDETYALRYVHDRNLYLLLGSKAEDKIVLNLLDPKTRKVSNLTINPKETIKAFKGNIKTMIPDIDHVVERIQKELVNAVVAENSKEVTTQTTQQQSPSSIPTFESSFVPRFTPPLFNPLRPSYDPLRDVGRGDLDPFGRGGGMLFPDPSHDPWLMRPQFPGVRYPPPPGSRFDPITPDINPGARPRADPNPDHFRPPPDFDDMYL